MIFSYCLSSSGLLFTLSAKRDSSSEGVILLSVSRSFSKVTVGSFFWYSCICKFSCFISRFLSSTSLANLSYCLEICSLNSIDCSMLNNCFPSTKFFWSTLHLLNFNESQYAPLVIKGTRVIMEIEESRGKINMFLKAEKLVTM